MEPLAHTLVGACLGETGLKRRTPLAMAALVVGAILPDVEGVCYLAGQDVAFQYRRGLTHGIVAMAVLPLALTGALLLYDRFVRRPRHPTSPPVRPGWLLALAFIGVLTHPVLDWTNTYGVRLLMPFSGRWFYGDALFIVDPWLWLLAGSAVVLATPRTRVLTTTWVVLGLATSALILTNPLVPTAARVTWIGAATLVAALRTRRPSTRSPILAWMSVGVTVGYILLMIAGARIAERRVRELGAREGWIITQAVAVPSPANPFVRDVIAVTPDRYLFVRVAWPGGPEVSSPIPSLPRGEPGPVVQAAMASPAVQGVRGWLRFPSYETQNLRDGGYRVLIRDARFAVGSFAGFGVVATVDLDEHLVPRRMVP